MSDQTKKPEAATTLTDADIAEEAPRRRSVLALISATVVGGAAKALGGCIVANPQPVQTGPVYAQPQQAVVVQQPGYQTGVTDGDSGAYADPVNGGRGTPRGMQTGVTDGDSGTYSDPVNGGRGRRGYQTGITDADSGSYADGVGRGRGGRRY